MESIVRCPLEVKTTFAASLFENLDRAPVGHPAAGGRLQPFRGSGIEEISKRTQTREGSMSYSNHDLAPDGKRIAALMPVEPSEAQQTQSHVIFLMNFSDELRRKVPVRK
jgi:hypothetical protein